jgi:hypothetical protein
MSNPIEVTLQSHCHQLVLPAAVFRDALALAQEVWWSRLHRPRMQAWADGEPLKMHVLKANANDPDPIAICCYGMLRKDTKKVMLRFAEDRPLSEVTIQFLAWLCQELEEEGKKRLIVIWDDASWHATCEPTVHRLVRRVFRPPLSHPHECRPDPTLPTPGRGGPGLRRTSGPLPERGDRGQQSGRPVCVFPAVCTVFCVATGSPSGTQPAEGQ